MIQAGRLPFLFIQRLRRSHSLELFRQIKNAPFVPRDQALAAQFRALSDLLAHAERNVPYYREMFRELGIRSRDVRSFEDFSQLPILTKDVIRERGHELVREDVPLEDLSPHHSGGSTGVPLTFYRDREYMDMSDAGTFRNLAQAGWTPGDMVAFFWGWNDKLNGMSRWEFELRQQMRRMYQFDPFQSGPEEMDRWIPVWKRIKPRVVLGYASTVARFAEHVESTGQHVSPVGGAFTTAEKLYPQQRETISRVFGCKVYDLYGSSEVQNIAAECSHGRMHVNADFVVAEVDRTSATPDESAPFLLTSLRNYAMPFIRYRNEDCGSLLEGECDCGNGFPLMQLDIARVSDNFVLPDGRVIHGEFFTHLMYGSEGIDTFQFHQTAPDRIILRIVPNRGAGENKDRSVRKVVQETEALAPGALTVEVEELESIPLSGAGKHRFTRTDVALPADTGVETNSDLPLP